MKGIVFTEFFEMVEDRFGGEMVERIIEESDLPSGAAYTAVGTYNYQELVCLVGRLSAAVQVGVPDLIQAFGQHLFMRFSKLYPQFFQGIDSAFAFLATIEDHIHVEVRKLYPDAELPTFTCTLSEPDRMRMVYRSKRPFGDLAEGLIKGCIAHFGQPIDIQRETLPEQAGTAICFTLTRKMS